MKAAVLHGANDITVEDVPEPEVGPDGVVVKVRACGICGSDLHAYRQGRGDDLVLGHEFSGDVVEVGRDVTGVAVGDRVTAMSGRGCGECYWCRRGEWLRCSRMTLFGYGVGGAFAEYTFVPNFLLNKYAVRLSDSVSYETAATTEPLSVALYSVMKMQPEPNDDVVVIGAGVIGLCAVQVLKALGIGQVILSGRRAGRLELAKRCGADIVIDGALEDAVSIVYEATSGKGADIVVECAGSAAAFDQSLRMVHRGGRIAVVGLYEQPIEWNPNSIVSNDIDLIGGGLRFDLPGAMELIEKKKVDTGYLVTHEFPLADIAKAFETQLTAPDAVKVLVKP